MKIHLLNDTYFGIEMKETEIMVEASSFERKIELSGISETLKAKAS